MGMHTALLLRLAIVIISEMGIRFPSPNDMINQSSIDVVYRSSIDVAYLSSIDVAYRSSIDVAYQSSIDVAYLSSIDVVIHSGRGKTYDILQGKGRNVRENGGEITLICCFNITKCIKTLVDETFFTEKCWLLNIYFLPLQLN